MGDVVKFYGSDAAKDPDVVLERSFGNYDDVLVIGNDKNGDLDVRASTNATRAELLWMLEHAKLLIMRLGDD